jgi:hypothetical protein
MHQQDRIALEALATNLATVLFWVFVLVGALGGVMYILGRS